MAADMTDAVKPDLAVPEAGGVHEASSRLAGFVDLAHTESYTVIVLGAVQALWLIAVRPFSGKGNTVGVGATTLRNTGGGALSPRAMFALRSAIAIYCVLLQVQATWDVGIRIHRFYTSWNWNLLCLYFAMAARQSWRLMKAEAGGGADAPVSRGGQLTAVLFHLCTTMAMYIDTVTWVALVPMLTTHNPDPGDAERFAGLFYCFRSYNQHGANLAFMLLDWALNAIPYFPHTLGWIQLMSCAYGVWTNIYFLVFGVWLYPFLDTAKPWAWEAYTALFVSHWVFFALFHLLMRIRRGVRGEAKAPLKRQ